MKLYDVQQKAVDRIIKSIKRSDAVFFQAPTGWGKTAVAVALANYFRKQGRNVIIATVRNDLVAQFNQTIIRMGAIEKPSIVVGRSNYIILDKALTRIKEIKGTHFEKFESFVEVGSFLAAEKESGKKFLFASDVEREHARIADTDIWLLVKIFATPKEEHELAMLPTLDESKFAVTNIFYLTSYLMSSDLKENTVVILDEVDYFSENVRNFFYDGFSLHSIKVMADFEHFQSDIEIFGKLAEKAESARNKASRIRASGLNNKEDLAAAIDELYKILDKTFSKRFLKEVQSALKNATNGMLELKKQISELNRFINEVKDRGAKHLAETGFYSISFSPVKRYPRVTRLGKGYRDGLALLHKTWKGMTANGCSVIGMGATVSPNFALISNRAEILKEVESVLSLPKNFDFEFIPLEDIAKREKRNITVYIAKENEPHFVYGDREKIDEFVKYITQAVDKTYKNGKAMVICKSRELSQHIGKSLEAAGLPAVYDWMADMKRTLTIFLNKDRGILVAHAGLGVGMDVQDIDQLYIAQLPFAVSRTTVFDKVKRDFVQWIGRLRENKETTKELYILDSRINQEKTAAGGIKKVIKSMRYEVENYYKEVKILE